MSKGVKNDEKDFTLSHSFQGRPWELSISSNENTAHFPGMQFCPRQLFHTLSFDPVKVILPALYERQYRIITQGKQSI